MKVTSFEIEDSTMSKEQKILVAIAEDGTKWVVGGNHWAPEFLDPYDTCFQLKPAKQ